MHDASKRAKNANAARNALKLTLDAPAPDFAPSDSVPAKALFAASTTGATKTEIDANSKIVAMRESTQGS